MILIQLNTLFKYIVLTLTLFNCIIQYKITWNHMEKKLNIGRPKLSKGIKKSVSVSINLSGNEKKQLEKLANKSGLSLSSCIRFYLKQNNVI